MGSTCDGFLQRIRQHGTEISVCLCVDFRLESCILLPNGMHTTSMLFKIEITKKIQLFGAYVRTETQHAQKNNKINTSRKRDTMAIL